MSTKIFPLPVSFDSNNQVTKCRLHLVRIEYNEYGCDTRLLKSVIFLSISRALSYIQSRFKNSLVCLMSLMKSSAATERHSALSRTLITGMTRQPPTDPRSLNSTAAPQKNRRYTVAITVHFRFNYMFVVGRFELNSVSILYSIIKGSKLIYRYTVIILLWLALKHFIVGGSLVDNYRQLRLLSFVKSRWTDGQIGRVMPISE